MVVVTDFIVALSVVFIVAGALLVVANHLGFPPVPFYILAGLLSGTVIADENLLELALWGIAFLVFVFGIRVDFEQIRSVLRDGEVAAFTQLAIVAPIAFIVGFLLGEFFGFENTFRNALYFSAAATLSSTLVGGRILREEIRNNLVHGRLAASIHFFDDMVAIGAILVLSADVLTDHQLVTSKIGYGVLFIILALIIYRHGYPLLTRVADGSNELILMGSVSILIGFIALAEIVEISIVVGAFAAGLAVRGDGAAHLGVRNGIESIKDFFAAIFFVTVGALVAIPTMQTLVLALSLFGLVVFVNPLIHTIAFVLEGYDGRTGFLAGSSLNQVSELALVVAIQAWLLESIAPALFDAIILAAAVTMILSAVAGRFEQRGYEMFLAPILEGRTGYIDENSAVTETLQDHVIIVGYGRQGRRIARTLETLERPYLVIENDPAIQSDLSRECENFVFGDAMAAYPLEKARVADARLIISTVDHEPVSRVLLNEATDADLILRADSSQEAEALLDAGARFVIVPSVLASDQLIENLERVLGDETTLGEIESNHRSFLFNIEEFERERRATRRHY